MDASAAPATVAASAVDRFGRAPPRIGFLFIGGAHQMLHIAPVAVELAKTSDCRVELFVSSPAEADRLAATLRALGSDLGIRLLAAPAWLRMLANWRGSEAPPKRLQLLVERRMLGEMDVLVTAERTSTFLKRLPGFTPKLVHIPHGAGDRERGFEERLRRFDHVIVAGPKDRNRMIADGLVSPDDCSVSGYVKLGAVLGLRASGGVERIFDDDRPIVLYNPHFAPGLGSWEMFGEAFARATADMADHNFILAPHVRLAERWSGRDRKRVESLAVPGRVIVDLGSERSYDMSYTMAADIYVGDVSSQVYEYLHVAKPCVFLNATGEDQRANRDFAFWRFGEVVDDPARLARAIADAPCRHAGFAGAQRAGVDAAFGPSDGQAPARAARIVRELARAAGG